MTFIDVCKECISTKDFVKEWNRLTGHRLGFMCTPFETAIDKACGYDPDITAMPDFVDFVYKYIWLPLVKQEAWERQN